MKVEYSKTMNTTTFYHSRIRYFTSPSLHRAVVEVERPGEVNNFIGGGRNNQIQTVSNFSVIGGGENNLMDFGDQRHSFIGGGQNNAVSSRWSGILGGQNNVIGAGLNDAFIVGSNINAVNAGALHVNGLWANGIPGPFAAIPPLPVGTVYFGPAGVPLGNVLYIV